MVMEPSNIRPKRHTLTLPHTAKQAHSNTVKEQTCPLEKLQVLVVEQAINGATRVRYIQPDSRPYSRHEQLKQASLKRRKNSSPGSESAG